MSWFAYSFRFRELPHFLAKSSDFLGGIANLPTENARA
jgi:hypothetical protein